MHEMALCRSVVDIVLEEGKKANATKVTGVYVTVGYARDIVEDLFEQMFTWLCRDTIAANAKLYLTRVPFTVKCEECGRVFPVNLRDPLNWLCPNCGEKHYSLNSGMEFYVNDIEIVNDVPDESQISGV